MSWLIRGNKTKIDRKSPVQYSKEELINYFATGVPRMLHFWEQGLVLSELFKKTKSKDFTDTLNSAFDSDEWKDKNNNYFPKTLELMTQAAIIMDYGWEAYYDSNMGKKLNLMDGKNHQYLDMMEKYLKSSVNDVTQNH